MDKEDGLEAEFEIILLDGVKDKERVDKKDESLWSQFENLENKFSEQRTMDRYEQIHFFFQVMIEHNVKTLKSCQQMKKSEEATRQRTQPDEVSQKLSTRALETSGIQKPEGGLDLEEEFDDEDLVIL